MVSAARYWDAYKEVWRLNVLTLMEYKANFFIWFLFTIVYHGVALAAIWVILTKFPSLNGWTRTDVFFLYALWMVGHTLNNSLFFMVGDVPDAVREGRFDRMLVRPLDSLFQIIAQPGQNFPDDTFVAIVVFAIASWVVHLQWSPLVALLVVMTIFSAAVIDGAVQLVIATLSFWVVRLDALRWVVMSLENDFTRFPLTMYNRAVRVILGYVFPFAFMNYFPATVLLHKTADAALFNPALGWMAPLVAGVWAVASLAFWRLGLDRYQGTGS